MWYESIYFPMLLVKLFSWGFSIDFSTLCEVNLESPFDIVL